MMPQRGRRHAQSICRAIEHRQSDIGNGDNLRRRQPLALISSATLSARMPAHAGIALTGADYTPILSPAAR